MPASPQSHSAAAADSPAPAVTPAVSGPPAAPTETTVPPGPVSGPAPSAEAVPAPAVDGPKIASFGGPNTGGSFDAKGRGLDFNLNCEGAGTINVSIKSGPGLSNFAVDCEAGTMRSWGNRDFTPHYQTTVQVAPSEGVTWAMSVGTVNPADAPKG